jgi:hypothetical protein
VCRQAGKHRLVAVALQLNACIKTKTTFESSVHIRKTFFKLIILTHATEESNSHLGCGFNEEMAYKVAGRKLKKLLFFTVLHIIYIFLNPPPR